MKIKLRYIQEALQTEPDTGRKMKTFTFLSLLCCNIRYEPRSHHPIKTPQTPNVSNLRFPLRSKNWKRFRGQKLQKWLGIKEQEAWGKVKGTWFSLNLRRKELKERIRKNLHKIKKKAPRLSTFTGAGRGGRSDLSWEGGEGEGEGL